MMIFPDSGASICLGGAKHVKSLELDIRSLIPCHKMVKAVGGSVLACRGWIPVQFTVRGNTMQQPMYVCDQVDRLYFSSIGCVETNILPECFPYPMLASLDQAAAIAISPTAKLTAPDTATISDTSTTSGTDTIPVNATAPTNVVVPTSDATPTQNPKRPTELPFLATEENVPKLKKTPR